MSGIVTIADSRPAPVWLRQLCGKGLPSLRRISSCDADILTLQAPCRCNRVRQPPKLGNSPLPPSSFPSVGSLPTIQMPIGAGVV
jgi:hypothetical protein